METRVDYALRPPEGVYSPAEADTFTADGWVVTGGKPLPVEEIRFDVASIYGVGPEEVFLAGIDGLPLDPMEAYAQNRTAEAFAATRLNLTPDLEAPGQSPALL